MKDKIYNTISECLLIFFDCMAEGSLKPLKQYLKYRREGDYWKGKDVHYTKADNF